jgi:hypothetical protein
MSVETPVGGTDGLGYAVRGVRSTPGPVIGPPLVVDSDRWRKSSRRGTRSISATRYW